MYTGQRNIIYRIESWIEMERLACVKSKMMQQMIKITKNINLLHH